MLPTLNVQAVIMPHSPTYYGVLQLLKSLGVRGVELPTNPRHGLLVDAVDFALRGPHRIRAVVNMPTLHNPLGSAMPDKAKQRLVEVCAAYDVAVIEDDVYADMHPGVAQLRAQKSWDTTGNVIYCSSLNKSLSPGLRLGWMLAGRWHNEIEALRMAQSRPKEELPQCIASRFLESGMYERHLKRLHVALAAQRKTLVTAVRDIFPQGTEVEDPHAGMLLWLKLPHGVSSERLFCSALGENIRLAPGRIFSRSAHFDDHVRLSCGWPLDRERIAALGTLARLCRQLMGSDKGSGRRTRPAA